MVHRADAGAYDRFIHFAGKSIFKNTDAVLTCWRSHPDFPTLTVVLWGLVLMRIQRSHPEWFDSSGLPTGWPNVNFVTHEVSDVEVKTMMNQNCPGTPGAVRRPQRPPW
jgi:hypothetical protein